MENARLKAEPAAVIAPNRVQQAFSIDRPKRVWVTDITRIRTYEGLLYLAGEVHLSELPG